MSGATRRGDASITVCPDGPLLVRGAVRLEDAEGTEVANDRNVIALCRCGRSARKPLCDGSHRSSRFRDPAGAADLAAALRPPGAPISSTSSGGSAGTGDPAPDRCGA